MKLHTIEYGSGPRTLVILHGLLGSAQNWHSAARMLEPKMHLVIPDQRNHGVSPHDAEHTIETMRHDLEECVDHLKLKKFFLLGHSMGGHVAMNFAFHHPERLNGLIVEDIAPRAYGTGLKEIVSAMSEVDLSQFKEKKSIGTALQDKIKSSVTRQFVLTNLVRHHDRLSWRVNLHALGKFADHEIARFSMNETHRFDGPTLFIGGTKSIYDISKEKVLIKRYFPAARIVMIKGAGHWLHYEAKEKFCELVLKFVKEN